MVSSNKRLLSKAREENFPRLTPDLYEVVDDETDVYNCIAYAAGDTTRWWWPDPFGVYYWPLSKREQTVECFIEMFESLDYSKCRCSLKRRSLVKIALYYDPVGCASLRITAGSPTHAAIQQNNGTWRSKLGDWELIEHRTLKSLNGTDPTGVRISYGEPVQIMRKARHE